MKICARCKREKEYSSFCKCKRLADGYQSACKECMNSSYTKTRQKYQERYQQVAKDRYKANTQRIREWKSAQGCIVCNETYAQCLELHHTNPAEKEFNPSEGYAKSWETFLVEAAKCVVVCANCHRKIHGGVIVLDQ